MNRNLLTFVFFMFFIYSEALPQQDTTFQKIVEIGRNNNQVMRHQDILCNRIGGRMTGSDALTTSENWALKEFKKWGLQAQLDVVGEVPIGFNRGPYFGKMISPKEVTLDFATPSYTSGTKGKQQGLVVIMPATDAEFDSQKSKIDGAWVLIEGDNIGWPRDRDSVREISKKLFNAGALGTIQRAPFPIRCLDLRTVDSWDNLPVLPDIKLLDTQFDEIKELVSKGQNVTLEFDIRNFFRPGPIKYYNVVGWIPGTEHPDEYVILGAHIDSYDIATGAIDNGSGVARMMEAIRILAKANIKPKRTIMIQLYASEERGLVGSKSWVSRNKEKLSKISLMINNDGGTNPLVAVSVPKVIYDVLKPAVIPIEKLDLKYPFELTEMGKFRRAGRGGTDSHSFNMEGVPAPWLRLQGPHQYRRTWHTPLDTYNEVIPDAQEHSALVIALLAYETANLNNLLPREGAFLPDGIYADLNTNKGRITINLDYEHVPMTAANFIGLAEGTIENNVYYIGKPYFNGSIWHRVVPGHVIQAGMPNIKTAAGEEIEGPGYEFPNEIYNGLSHNKAGMVGMANSGPNTNGSQFYITLGDRSYLDGNYTLFGSVAEGMDVVDKIIQGDTIKSVSIIRIGENANSFKCTTESFGQMVEKAKEKVNSEAEIKKKEEADWIEKNIIDAASTSDGIIYKIVNEASGETPIESSVLKVKYSGKVLINKLYFVSTSDEGKPNFGINPEVFDYIVGKTKINNGIDKILSNMKPGEKRIAIIPAILGYGDDGYYGKNIHGEKRFVISPNSTLYYEIEVIK